MTRPTPEAPHATCPTCHHNIKITPRGKWRKHYTGQVIEHPDTGTVLDLPICPNSGQPVEGLDNVVRLTRPPKSAQGASGPHRTPRRGPGPVSSGVPDDEQDGVWHRRQRVVELFLAGVDYPTIVTRLSRTAAAISPGEEAWQRRFGYDLSGERGMLRACQLAMKDKQRGMDLRRAEGGLRIDALRDELLEAHRRMLMTLVPRALQGSIQAAAEVRQNLRAIAALYGADAPAEVRVSWSADDPEIEAAVASVLSLVDSITGQGAVGALPPGAS